MIQFVTCISPIVGGHLSNRLKGSRFTIPKRSQRIARFVTLFLSSFVPKKIRAKQEASKLVTPDGEIQEILLLFSLDVDLRILQNPPDLATTLNNALSEEEFQETFTQNHMFGVKMFGQ